MTISRLCAVGGLLGPRRNFFKIPNYTQDPLKKKIYTFRNFVNNFYTFYVEITSFFLKKKMFIIIWLFSYKNHKFCWCNCLFVKIILYINLKWNLRHRQSLFQILYFQYSILQIVRLNNDFIGQTLNFLGMIIIKQLMVLKNSEI